MQQCRVKDSYVSGKYDVTRLTQVDAQVASEQAIRALQSALPAVVTRAAPRKVEIEGVSPCLLLAPHHSSSVPSALTGRCLTLGSRIAFVGSSGGPLFGSRGTVVGIHADDYEVLFDAPFVGGNDLQSR